MRCVSYKTDKLASFFGNLVYFSDSHTTCMTIIKAHLWERIPSMEMSLLACKQTHDRHRAAGINVAVKVREALTATLIRHNETKPQIH